jgi:hypothetical protein
VGGETWKKRANFPESIFTNSSMTACNGSIYFCAYRTGTSPNKGLLWRYQITADQWVPGTLIPFSGYISSMVSIGKKIAFIVNLTSNPITEIWIYDTEMEAWTKIVDGPAIHDESQILSFGESLVVVSSNKTGEVVTPTLINYNYSIKIQAYDFQNGRWDNWTPVVVRKMRGVVPVVIKNEILLLDQFGQTAIHYYP